MTRGVSREERTTMTRDVSREERTTMTRDVSREERTMTRDVSREERTMTRGVSREERTMTRGVSREERTMMTCDNNFKRALVFFFVLFCVHTGQTSALRNAQEFDKKVSLVLQEEPERLKCFVEGTKDLTCFWEEEEEGGGALDQEGGGALDQEGGGALDQYSFMYAYQTQNSSRCPLRRHRRPDGSSLLVCHLNRTQMFVQMDVQVCRGGRPIHNRSLLLELLFLLDPPGNVTVSRTKQLDQLRVVWVPPAVKYLDDSMMYEVSYSTEPGRPGKVEEVPAGSALLLTGLAPEARYEVRVRVKLDGISYGGFWSAWSDPVVTETPSAGVDLLIVFLVLIISLILALLLLTLALTNRRFIIKKIWPAIPNPESKFQGLFSVYGGDFQEWLDQTNGSLWLRPAVFYSEERPSPLEVLSELSPCPPLPSPPLPPKASRGGAVKREEEAEVRRASRPEDVGAGEGRRETPHDRWLMEQLRLFHQLPAPPPSTSSQLESQDAYVTLDPAEPPGVDRERPDGVPEEGSPPGALFAPRRAASSSSESRSDLGSGRRSSGSGRVSSRSSFECPVPAWPPAGPGYTYMAVADSGVSVDYSLMGSGRTDDVGKTSHYSGYKNEFPGGRRALPAGEHPHHHHHHDGR